MNQSVDKYLNEAKNWQVEMRKLREILLECGLNEEFKWKQPCYTLGDKNIIIIGSFKNYCALLLVKGALMDNSNDLIITPTENSQSGRQVRFTKLQEIEDNYINIKAIIYEAIEVEKSGAKVLYKKADEFEVVEELEVILAADASLRSAFDQLTPGRKKGYYLFFAGAKQSKTRTARIEKSIPRIINGKGINDCICGHSKRMPGCDGSHKYL
jgi:uncharacterized protein YdeI (YjbR/CyaY-like superfamily)